MSRSPQLHSARLYKRHWNEWDLIQSVFRCWLLNVLGSKTEIKLESHGWKKEIAKDIFNMPKKMFKRTLWLLNAYQKIQLTFNLKQNKPSNMVFYPRSTYDYQTRIYFKASYCNCKLELSLFLSQISEQDSLSRQTLAFHCFGIFTTAPQAE